MRRVRQALPLADEETDELDGWDAEVSTADSPQQLKGLLSRLESALREEWLSPLAPGRPTQAPPPGLASMW